MTWYKHQPVLIVPAARVAQVNALLQRHGYGPNFVSVPCIGKASAPNAPTTHYCVEAIADEGLRAALMLAIRGVPQAKLVHGKRGPKKLEAELDKENLKPKPRK